MDKNSLTKLEKLIPNNLLNQIQYIHSSLLSKWILLWGSQPLKFSQKSAMVFSPHQDDETLGCGGMIARKREQGISVVVTFLTDGRGSHGSDPHIQNQIIQIRKQESLKALSILGVQPSEIYFFDQPDGTLPDLKAEERQQTIDQISQLLKQYQPGEVYVPHRKDCHKDHEATYSLVKEAIAQLGIKLELLEYPIWVFWRAPLFILLKLKDIRSAYRLSITSVQDKKKRAIAAYPSQIQTLPRGFIKRFLNSEEIFFHSKH
ncbi:PIG-L family deacetylase [Sphaerospermopsis aphanizomenoides BCCUSP55]|uniref:PIG-L deacetylase family protein n=1 Tax=Sphaerospermopsis aphanizomenoides TaxID=459663 RepID=UPI000AA23CD1|nr:PIG-L family deacetylase [Sphaerospermopsis aphanizomenoides]MBK1986710.1 PIG-L family deacetylase [Sphaerospermopsis aphanizomenoides BCCUSP55]